MTLHDPAIAGRNVSISREHQFVWFRVAKTGTRSLDRLLESGVSDYQYFSGPNSLASELAENDFFRFSIVRNPWDRLVSAWRNKIVREESKKSPEFLRKLNSTASQEELSSAREDFPLFVRLLADSQLFAKNIHFMPQTAILAGVELDYMGRFERYAGDIEHVLSVVGLSRLMPSLPHLNSTNNRKHYGQYYDRESRDIVGDLFQADVIKWGYSFKTEE